MITEFNNAKDERLFKGSAEDYINLRAKKHRSKYCDEKQALVLESLAYEVKMMRKAITDAQNILAEFIIPDSNMNEEKCINELLDILDNRELVIVMK